MVKKVITGNYKNAFNCKKCPKRADEKGCPMWWEMPVEDEYDPNKVELWEGCGYVLMPFVLKSVIKAGYTGAEEVSSMRSEVVNTVETATSKFLQLQAAEAQLRLQYQKEEE